MSEILFDSNGYHIEFHSRNGNKNGLVFTFTPFMFSNLNNDGFGVKFLINEGYDVVSFKCVNDSWFQNIPLSAIESAAAIGKNYKNVLTYGSSMGGFAAIAFSDLLSATHAIAISPQYSIRDEFDKRWSKQAAAISRWTFEIRDGSCENCRVTILYDNHIDLDRLQVEKIIEKIGSKDIQELKVPFSGHPTGHFLNEIGVMSATIRSILNRDDNLKTNYKWSRIRKSYIFNLFLGIHAEKNGRKNLAFLCFSRCFELKPRKIESLYRILPLLSSMGRFAEVLEYCDRAVALQADDASFRRQLSNILNRAGQLEAAIAHGTRAVELDPDNANFRHQLSNMLSRAGQVEAAIVHATRAVELDPDNASYRHQLSDILQRSGR